jgi:carboxypeptidase Taq
MINNITSKELYTQYKNITQKAADLQYASAVLGWDQEVYMPAKGFELRGRQMATLASLAHEMVTNEAYGNLLDEIHGRNDLAEDEKQNIRLSREDFEKNKKLPVDFIEALTQQTSASYSSWLEARSKNDYSLYAAELQKMIELKKQQADYYGYEEHAYNSLLDDYEKGANVALLDSVFETVKEQLPQLLKKISSAQQVNDDFFLHHYPKQQQWDFSIDVLKRMGYDFEAGRQDISEHPFTTSFSPVDVRVTTRVDENNFSSLLWSSIHEGGHALYEQGLPESQYGLPLSSAASLSIHESQSRLWENCIGRSYRAWKYFYPKLQQYFPSQLGGISLDKFYKGMNKVESSFIRTEADEITYHFHVLIRYEIEKALISGTLQSKDVKEMWNEQYKKYLGVIVPDDKSGILQDVHWSHGMFGYFPTYSLGSFYASQFFAQAEQEIAALPRQIENGEFAALLQWLREKIHVHGRRYRSEELCKQITGKGLDFSYFMRYAEGKFNAVYDI